MFLCVRETDQEGKKGKTWERKKESLQNKSQERNYLFFDWRKLREGIVAGGVDSR